MGGTADPQIVYQVLKRVDGSGSESDRAARRELDALDLGAELPRYLLEKFRSEKKRVAREECLRLSMRYARESEDAFRMAIEGLNDRSWVVAHMACILLSFSLRKDALPALREVERSGRTEKHRDRARRAIDAIEHQNHNYFIDTKHTGKAFLSLVGYDFHK